MVEVNLLDVAKMQTAVQTVNRRLKTLADTFGTESNFYQNEVAKLDAQVPTENIVYKDGVFQLRQPKKLAQSGVDSDFLKTLIRTKADIKTEYRYGYDKLEEDFEWYKNLADENSGLDRQLFEDGVKEPTDVYKYAESISNLLDKDTLKIISDKAKAGDSDADVILYNMKKGTKSYLELWQMAVKAAPYIAQAKAQKG
jgi:hypothetical protein